MSLSPERWNDRFSEPDRRSSGALRAQIRSLETTRTRASDLNLFCHNSTTTTTTTITTVDCFRSSKSRTVSL